MKIFLRNLMLAALFMVPAFGQTTTPPDPILTDSQVIEPPVAEPPVAEPPVQAFPVEKAEEPASGYSMFRVIGGLGLVIFLMIAGCFALKKFPPLYFANRASEKNLKVIETLSMGDKRSIAMIEVGNRRFLVGNTAQQLSLLIALPESDPLTSQSETLSESAKGSSKKEDMIPFRKMFEVEKKRPTQYAAQPLPEDIRTKMRQLREALER